ncbi:MAG: hypothetical protein H7Y41_03085 [Hyphomonadaceae bacterium]|nr:hypothetical protein [Clostridia bacterium]
MGRTKIEEIQYGSWGRCVSISNEQVDLVATLDIGPRIIRFGVIGKPNMFFEDTARVANIASEDRSAFNGDIWYLYGGHRLWTSPEAAPRSYYPDNHPVQYELVENGVLLKPDPEKWTGNQKEIEITLDPDSSNVTVTHRVKNIGAWPMTFAAWALSVMSPGGVEIVPQTQTDTGLLGNRILTLWPYAKMNDSRVYWGEKYIRLMQDVSAQGPFKFGSTNEDGWATYFNHGCMFVKYYKHDNNASYPDYGVSFETYTNPLMLEVETLSPLTEVMPGNTLTHVEQWQLFDGVSVPSTDEDEITQTIQKYITTK